MCVCVCVCLRVHTYVLGCVRRVLRFIYIFIFQSEHIYLCSRANTSQQHMCVFLCTHVCLCLCGFGNVCASGCAFQFVYTHWCLGVKGGWDLCMYLCSGANVCIFVCIYV